MGIEYTRGWTIAVGSLSFSQRVLSPHPSGIHRNWHNLASDAEWKERVDWSEQQEVDIRSV